MSKMVVPEAVELGKQAAEEITSSEEYPLRRQSSIFSLTLDEFQNNHCGKGKNFGSMNMDEFLNDVWTAEENHATHSDDDDDSFPSLQHQQQQSSLPRQVSLSLPSPLYRRTVEEVWAEIQEEAEEEEDEQDNNGGATTTHRQPTFGEMTLEDFLIKAGVVREAYGSSSAQHNTETQQRVTVPLRIAPAPEAQQYGLYLNNNTAAALEPNDFGTGPLMSLGFTDHQHYRSSGDSMGVVGVQSKYQVFPPPSGGVVGETSNYVGNGNRNEGGYPGTGGVCFGGRAGNGGGAYGTTIAPASPGSSDGICVENSGPMGIRYAGAEMGGIRRRKRAIVGPAEVVVVERRQRRMIKNRESAARSRARKQVNFPFPLFHCVLYFQEPSRAP